MEKSKKITPLILVVIVFAVGGYFIGRGSVADQGAALYKAGSLNMATAKTLACDAMNTNPIIKLITPNGGQLFTPEQRIDVQWSSCNIATGAKIQIMLENANNGKRMALSNPTQTNITNDGQEVVVIPKSWELGAIASVSSGGSGSGSGGPVQTAPAPDYYGNYYKIYIADTGPAGTQANPAGIINDSSDTNISIVKNSVLMDPRLDSVFQVTPAMVQTSTGNYTGQFIIKFRVMAGGSDVYISKDIVKSLNHYAERLNGGAVNQGIIPKFSAYVVTGNGGPVQTSGTGPTSSAPLVSLGLTANGNYKIPIGTTALFVLTTDINLPAAGPAGQYRTKMTAIHWSTKDTTTPSHTYFLNPMYKTGYLQLN